MKITEEQKQQLINLNDSRVNEILGVTTLNDNTWYIYDDGYLQFNLKDGEGYGYGGDEWYEIAEWLKHKFNGKFREATHEEVENALIAEAKRRYKCGDKVKCVSKTYYNEIAEIDMKRFRFYANDNDLWVSSEIEACNVCIFKNGKWAEVIEKPNKQEIINQINELLKQL